MNSVYKTSNIFSFVPFAIFTHRVYKEESFYLSYGKKVEKRIGIGLNSLIYLEDLKTILKEFGINSNIRKNGHIIITKENLKKVYKNFNFVIKRKQKRLESIINCYEKSNIKIIGKEDEHTWNRGHCTLNKAEIPSVSE